MIRYLIDTNVLVYGFNAAGPAKQERALNVVARLGRLGPGGVAAPFPFFH